MSTKNRREPKSQPIKPISLDPRYAAARPWDWCICQSCDHLIPVLRCPGCGGVRFSSNPKAIIRQALRQHGLPPSKFDSHQIPEKSANKK